MGASISHAPCPLPPSPGVRRCARLGRGRGQQRGVGPAPRSGHHAAGGSGWLRRLYRAGGWTGWAARLLQGGLDPERRTGTWTGRAEPDAGARGKRCRPFPTLFLSRRRSEPGKRGKKGGGPSSGPLTVNAQPPPPPGVEGNGPSSDVARAGIFFRIARRGFRSGGGEPLFLCLTFSLPELRGEEPWQLGAFQAPVLECLLRPHPQTWLHSA